ncbi:hypothetical protein BOX15_Mlig017681g1, partial [Macrostomum lignano]
LRKFSACRRFLSSSSSSSSSYTASASPAQSSSTTSSGSSTPSHLDGPELLLPRSGHFYLDPFTPADYAERRRLLFEEFTRRLSSDKQFADFDRHILLVPSAQQQFMAHHVPYTMRQNSYFRYLTGHLGADAMLVLACNGGSGVSDFDTARLLVHRQSETERLWDGGEPTPVEAAQRAGLLDPANSGLYTEDEEAAKFLADQMTSAKGKLALWYNYKEPANGNLDRSLVLAAVKQRGPQAVANIEPVLDRVRWRKSAKELAVMRRAALIGSEAMNSAMRATKPDINEAAVWAVLDFECRRLGADRLAYPPVIGGGQRSTVIHYMKNNRPVQPPDLILADSGADVQGYVSDITRTWPASPDGFTPHQLVAYEIVRQLLIDCRDHCRIGVSLDDVHLYMGQKLRARLIEASMLTEAGASLSSHALCHALCPHHVSHYLGMDVHDTPSVSRSEPLQCGVVFPLEPGLYLSPDCQLVHQEFRGLGGVRLEDDFAIGDTGELELLTGSAALDPETVQRLAGDAETYSASI